MKSQITTFTPESALLRIDKRTDYVSKVDSRRIIPK